MHQAGLAFRCFPLMQSGQGGPIGLALSLVCLSAFVIWYLQKGKNSDKGVRDNSRATSPINPKGAYEMPPRPKHYAGVGLRNLSPTYNDTATVSGATRTVASFDGANSLSFPAQRRYPAAAPRAPGVVPRVAAWGRWPRCVALPRLG